MDDNTNESTAAVDTGQEGLLNLGMWLGRHQAFGLIANQCSAGDAECLKIIRENEHATESRPAAKGRLSAQAGGWVFLRGKSDRRNVRAARGVDRVAAPGARTAHYSD